MSDTTTPAAIEMTQAEQARTAEDLPAAPAPVAAGGPGSAPPRHAWKPDLAGGNYGPPIAGITIGPAGDVRLTLALIGSGPRPGGSAVSQVERAAEDAARPAALELQRAAQTASSAQAEADVLAGDTIPRLERAATQAMLSGDADAAECKLQAARALLARLHDRAKRGRQAAEEADRRVQQAQHLARRQALQGALAGAVARREAALRRLTEGHGGLLSEIAEAVAECEELTAASQWRA
jgi:hypothetical protein